MTHRDDIAESIKSMADTAIRRVFKNWRDYEAALDAYDTGETMLVTNSGLKIVIRHNKWDAIIVAEQFLARGYLRYFAPPTDRRAVIVDVGGYIGDFALYCAHEFGAHVVAYEPVTENFAIFRRNCSLNPALTDRVVAVNKGVSSGADIVAYVQVLGNEIHASSELFADDPRANRRVWECDSLGEVLDRNGLERVDLLKVDCEGGEYDIFTDVPQAVYDRIAAIVVEAHHTPGWETKIPRLQATLKQSGYRVIAHDQLLHALRS